MSWPLVFASGGPRERGRAYGAQAAEQVQGSVAFYEEVFLHYTGLGWRDVRRRAEAFIDPIEAYDETLLPELEGIAEGAGVTAEDLLAVNLRTEVMFGLDRRPDSGPSKECTALSCEDTGGIVVAQNWDWKPAVRDHCVLLVSAPHEGPGSVTLVEAGLWAKCGANDAGIGLATNSLQSSRDRGSPGVPYHAILRRILSSSTYEEAVAAVLEAARASSANYLIGHRDGRAVNLEALPGGRDDVFVTEGPGLSHTNHFLWPSPRDFKDLGLIGGGDSPVRQARAALAVAGAGGIDSVRKVLQSHDDGENSVCAHGDPAIPRVEDYITVGAFVADLAAGTVELTHGPSCTAPFERFHVDELVERARAGVAV